MAGGGDAYCGGTPVPMSSSARRTMNSRALNGGHRHCRGYCGHRRLGGASRGRILVEADHLRDDGLVHVAGTHLRRDLHPRRQHGNNPKLRNFLLVHLECERLSGTARSRGGGALTLYCVRSLSGISARKWLALTTQCAPTVPNPGRRQKASPLLETGGPMTVRVRRRP
jgi:hypothetical protein